MDLIVDFPQNRISSSLRKRRVSFQDELDVKFVQNLSHKHRDDIWFSADEMHSFRYKTALTVRTITSTMTMAEYAELHVKDTSAFLGLEKYLSQDAFRGIKHRKRSNPKGRTFRTTPPVSLWHQRPRCIGKSLAGSIWFVNKASTNNRYDSCQEEMMPTIKVM